MHTFASRFLHHEDHLMMPRRLSSVVRHPLYFLQKDQSFTSTVILDGYTTPAANRTQFPLSGGYFTLNFSHAEAWSGKILTHHTSHCSYFILFSSWSICFDLSESHEVRRIYFKQRIWIGYQPWQLLHST